nr:DUF4424 family protein [uncultured Cohaesibacter sp.]
MRQRPNFTPARALAGRFMIAHVTQPSRLTLAALAALALTFAISLSCSRALANDSTAMIDATGIRLIETHAISLDVEDLYLSPQQVQIHYEFVNNSDQNQHMLVAFPVPEIDSHPETNYAISPVSPLNFLDFHVSSNGQDIMPGIEIKLTLNGVDFTSDILKTGIPLSRFDPTYYDKLEALAEPDRMHLASLGLIDWQPGEEYIEPKWKMQTIYYWYQDFPANSRTVIDHSYSPVVGGGIISEEYGVQDNVDRFCIDDGFIRGFRRLLAKGGHAETLSKEVRYILKTANNWLGPIGDFRLVIDKEKPENLVTLCINGIRKIAPTQFEFRARNYVPDQDIDLMVVEMPDW